MGTEEEIDEIIALTGEPEARPECGPNGHVRRFIGGLAYDTRTADFVCSDDRDYREDYYRTKKGKWFGYDNEGVFYLKAKEDMRDRIGRQVLDGRIEKAFYERYFGTWEEG